MQIERKTLFQVVATDTKTHKQVAVPFFPRMDEESVKKFAGDMREMIAKGREKRYSEPQVIACIHS